MRQRWFSHLILIYLISDCQSSAERRSLPAAAADDAVPASAQRTGLGMNVSTGLALERGIPDLLAAAVRSARTRLTSHPRPSTRKGGHPGAVGAGATRAHRATCHPPGTPEPDTTVENRPNTIRN